MTNEFNHIFTETGRNHAESIPIVNNFTKFLKNKTKNSYDFDGISSKLLKLIEPDIVKPLTILINQVLNTGKFPDKLKVAKVIPLFKRNDPTLFTNYRPKSHFACYFKSLGKNYE